MAHDGRDEETFAGVSIVHRKAPANFGGSQKDIEACIEGKTRARSEAPKMMIETVAYVDNFERQYERRVSIVEI